MILQLDTTVNELLPQVKAPEQLFEITSSDGELYWLVGGSVLSMAQMDLGHLPLSAFALPKAKAQLIENLLQPKVVKDVSRRLSHYFPNKLVVALYELQSYFQHAQVQAYLIGGLTRDLLLSDERKFDVEDVDITIEGLATHLAKQLEEDSKNIKLVELFDQFGTAKLQYHNDFDIDLASTRQEQYTAVGALPEITAYAVPLVYDVVRRDFTINALALSITNLGQIIDCCGGLEDIESQTLRLLRPTSLFQDTSRIFRMLKFQCRLGFSPSEDSLYLLKQFMPWVASLYKGGGERIKSELMELLGAPASEHKAKALRLLNQFGLHRLMDTTLPAQIDWPIPFEQLLQRMDLMQQKLGKKLTSQHLALIWLTLIIESFTPQQQQHIMDRLLLNRAERATIIAASALLNENTTAQCCQKETSLSSIDRAFTALPFEAACVGALLSHQFESILGFLLIYKEAIEPVNVELCGDDLIALGVASGEHIKLLLQVL